MMTQEFYDRTQKIPERIEGAKRGKALIPEFIDAAKMRFNVEYPELVEEWETDANYRVAEIMNLFWKYLIEYEYETDTKRASLVALAAYTPSKHRLIWHNGLEKGGSLAVAKLLLGAAKDSIEHIEISEKEAKNG